MTRALIIATYVLACMTVGAAVMLFAGVPTGLLVGLVAFLFVGQFDNAAMRRRDAKRAQREIGHLKRKNLGIERALAESSAKMDEMRKVMDERTSAQNKKIVSELKVLESLMKDFAGKIATQAQSVAVDEHMAAMRPRDTARSYLDSLGEPELLETIRAALEENRVDLYLQPIVSLPQRKLRFYEALSRLRAEDGSVIMPAQYMKVAAPAGLMSVVDNLLLFRCVQIVRRLTQKQRDVGVFCNISGDTLTDAEFFPQFLEFMHHHRDLAGQIVFEFSQKAIEAAGQAGEANLVYLSSMGFALSVDNVHTLAIDFGKLKKLGFRHLKVRANMLVGGMEGANAAVAAEDFKPLVERHGLNLVVERVEDEKTVVQLLDYNVDFAQGFLFGEPRAVREDGGKPVAEPKNETSAPVIPMRRKAG